VVDYLRVLMKLPQLSGSGSRDKECMVFFEKPGSESDCLLGQLNKT